MQEKMRRSPSVSEQTETSPLSERCPYDLTLKEKSWQFMLLSENGGRVKERVLPFKKGINEFRFFSYS